MIPADSTLTTVFDGIEISAMDYAEITFAIQVPESFLPTHPYVIGYGPSPRMKMKDFPPNSRQKLILSDCAFLSISYTDDAYHIPIIGNTHLKVFNDHPYHFPYEEDMSSDGLGNDITFDFDLSQYDCDFDIYIIVTGTQYIFDNAFSNFKMSDNIKSIHLYMLHGNIWEIGHNAFSSIPYFDSVNLTYLANYVRGGVLPDGKHYWYKYLGEASMNQDIYNDSFSEETYNRTPLITKATEEEINYAKQAYSSSYYHYFKNVICGVEDIAIDETKTDIIINGKMLIVQGATPGQIVQVYNIEGSKIGQVETDSSGFVCYTINLPGVLLVKVGQYVSKFVVF